jgi:hypothetical protein
MKSTGEMGFFCESTANNFVSLKSVINVGDVIVIDSAIINNISDVEVVVMDMSIVLNNSRILPTELTILFKFRDVNSNCEYLLTHQNFRYVKHNVRVPYGNVGKG